MVAEGKTNKTHRDGAVPQPQDDRVPPRPRVPQARGEQPHAAGSGAAYGLGIPPARERPSGGESRAMALQRSLRVGVAVALLALVPGAAPARRRRATVPGGPDGRPTPPSSTRRAPRPARVATTWSGSRPRTAESEAARVPAHRRADQPAVGVQGARDRDGPPRLPHGAPRLPQRSADRRVAHRRDPRLREPARQGVRARRLRDQRPHRAADRCRSPGGHLADRERQPCQQHREPA